MCLNFNNSLISRVLSWLNIVNFEVKTIQKHFQTHIKHDTNTFYQTNIYLLLKNQIIANTHGAISETKTSKL